MLYCGGCSVLCEDSISSVEGVKCCGEISSVLWRETTSTMVVTSTVLKILSSTQGIPPQYWTSSTLLNTLHCADSIPPEKWWYFSAVLNILYSTHGVSPHYWWYHTTVKSTLHSTAQTLFHCFSLSGLKYCSGSLETKGQCEWQTTKSLKTKTKWTTCQEPTEKRRPTHPPPFGTQNSLVNRATTRSDVGLTCSRACSMCEKILARWTTWRITCRS